MNAALVLSTYVTPVGNITVRHDERFVYNAVFTDQAGSVANTPIASLIANEIDAYFNDPLHSFQLSFKPEGSAYQQTVWQALLEIPSGKTLTYGELATKLQSAPRAIGQACKRNPIAFFIPCHRVVGKNDLGGYMGFATALSYKSALLTHESNQKLG